MRQNWRNNENKNRSDEPARNNSVDANSTADAITSSEQIYLEMITDSLDTDNLPPLSADFTDRVLASLHVGDDDEEKATVLAASLAAQTLPALSVDFTDRVLAQFVAPGSVEGSIQSSTLQELKPGLQALHSNGFQSVSRWAGVLGVAAAVLVAVGLGIWLQSDKTSTTPSGGSEIAIDAVSPSDASPSHVSPSSVAKTTVDSNREDSSEQIDLNLTESEPVTLANLNHLTPEQQLQLLDLAKTPLMLPKLERFTPDLERFSAFVFDDVPLERHVVRTRYPQLVASVQASVQKLPPVNRVSGALRPVTSPFGVAVGAFLRVASPAPAEPTQPQAFYAKPWAKPVC